MKIWKSIIRRFVMTLLFFGALLSTYHSISGVEAKNIVSYVMGTENTDTYMVHKLKTIALAYKNLKTAIKPTTEISSAQEVAGQVPSLEEAFNWEKYPTKQVIATGYTAGFESTGKNPDSPQFGITYSGVKVKRDLYSTIAADLNVFPIGTVLFIPDYGYGVVADKGGAIRGNKLDLYYETVNDVYNHWGKKTLDVYVIKMGDGSLTERELSSLNEKESMQVFRQQYIKAEQK